MLFNREILILIIIAISLHLHNAETVGHNVGKCYNKTHIFHLSHGIYEFLSGLFSAFMYLLN